MVKMQAIICLAGNGFVHKPGDEFSAVSEAEAARLETAGFAKRLQPRGRKKKPEAAAEDPATEKAVAPPAEKRG